MNEMKTERPGARIALVEDEMIIAHELKVRLSTLGHSVVGMFRRGEEVLSLVQTTTIDLFLIDIALAGQLDGIETAKQIRTMTNARIVFLTANADDATRRRAQTLSPDGFLLKPFTEEELGETIQKSLQRLT
jgi:DNA-binding NarL/FixJ family response regulator